MKVLKYILIGVTLLVTIVITIMFGWRIFGFTFCSSPYRKDIVVTVEVTDEYVEPFVYNGKDWILFAVKKATVYEFEGNTLKIGFATASVFDYLFGNVTGLTMPAIAIPEGVVVDKVILCGGGKEAVIWTREEGNIRFYWEIK